MGTKPEPNRNDLKKKFEVCRELQDLCDCELIVTDNRGVETAFPIHKVIVAGASPFLRALLSKNWKESNQRRVHVRDVSAEMMRIVLSWAYGEEPTLNEHNFVEAAET